MMRVVFTFRSRMQLQDIHDYIARDSVSAADTVVARVEHVANSLSANSHIGRKIGSRLRRLPVPPYPYLIYYEVVETTVRIVRVRHAARYRQAFQEPARVFAR
jgi:plasmid stabilization system protein ParE